MRRCARDSCRSSPSREPVAEAALALSFRCAPMSCIRGLALPLRLRSAERRSGRRCPGWRALDRRSSHGVRLLPRLWHPAVPAEPERARARRGWCAVAPARRPGTRPTGSAFAWRMSTASRSADEEGRAGRRGGLGRGRAEQPPRARGRSRRAALDSRDEQLSGRWTGPAGRARRASCRRRAAALLAVDAALLAVGRGRGAAGPPAEVLLTSQAVGLRSAHARRHHSAVTSSFIMMLHACVGRGARPAGLAIV